MVNSDGTKLSKRANTKSLLEKQAQLMKILSAYEKQFGSDIGDQMRADYATDTEMQEFSSLDK